MEKANSDIIQEAKSTGTRLWQIAERYNGGMNDGNFSRKLHHELPPEEKAKIRTIIKELSTKLPPTGKVHDLMSGDVKAGA